MIQYSVPFDDKSLFVVYQPTINVIDPSGFSGHLPFYIYLKPVTFTGQIDVHNDHPVASFSLMALPGNCGGVIGYGMSTHGSYIKAVSQIRDDLVRRFGYSLIIATAIKSGGTEPALRNPENGYEIVEEFTNRRTSNNIIVGFKAL